MIKRKLFILSLTLSLIFIAGITDSANGQNNVIIIVMDGAGWIHTFGGGDTYIPHLYNDMRPYGTLYTDFRIDYNAGGQTLTNPGNATIATGAWQSITNDGIERPTLPTIFEYYRSHFAANQNTCYVVAGKTKLNILTYSVYSGYGQEFGASWLGNNLSDQETFNNLVATMSTIKPNLLIVNFADVDRAGDSGNLAAYTAAITTADNYIYQIWQHIQNEDWGYNASNTTLFITNDHGRNDTIMTEHGDGCDGCTHIMLLALGRNVVPQVVTTTTYQRDIAPTVGDLLGFSTPQATGLSLFEYSSPLPVELISFTSRLLSKGVLLKWETGIEVNNYGFEVERMLNIKSQPTEEWNKIGFVNGNGNSSSYKYYSFSDNNLQNGKYLYRLKQIDNDGTFEYSSVIEVEIGSPNEYTLYQNFPNPFNPNTMISYNIPVSGFVSLKVFDVLGNEVATLVDEDKSAGVYNVEFRMQNVELSSGIYFYRLQSGDFVKSRKMVILK